MKRENYRPEDEHAVEGKGTYKKPEVKRVDLALAETLSSGCKLAGVCDDPFEPISEAGS